MLKIIPGGGDFSGCITSCSCPGGKYLSKDKPFSYDAELLALADNCLFILQNGFNELKIVNDGRLVFDPTAALDSGEKLEMGEDYFVYLCIGGNEPYLTVSKNATFPNGETARSSSRIGGFHFGAVRKVSDDGLWAPVDGRGNKFGCSGIKWQDNVTVGIVPNSVWDLKNCPRTLIGGLAKVGNIWVSIYQASKKSEFSFMTGDSLSHVAEGELQSRYGQLPVSGIDGLCQYNFVELADRAGMRLLKYTEWLAAAYGAPQGMDHSNLYGWCDVTNKVRARTGCSVNLDTGRYDPENRIKPYAVSARNIVDTTGNVWEWLSEYSNRHDAGSGLWTYYDQLGPEMGQIYGWKTDSFSSLAGGGHWHRGACCGPRAINPDDQPWKVNVHIGTRLACDAL